MNRVGLIQDLLYLEHDTGLMHPERPDRLRSIQKMLQDSHLISKTIALEPREATREELAYIHTSEMIEQVAQTQSYEHFNLDADTAVSKHSWQAAKLAAGGLLVALDVLFEGKLDAAFAFPRPPGHHAERDHAMGFCLFNNIAIAAEYALRTQNLKRVLILDFDVHHGNGTQHSFEDRNDVFFISTHRYPFYPGTGSAFEKGKGAGQGYTLNLPMDARSSDADYDEIFRERIVPAILEYKPELLLISAGFDAHERDPLGGMNVSNKGFRNFAEHIELVRKKLNVPLLYTLEGGYDLQGLAESVKEVVEVMIKNA